MQQLTQAQRKAECARPARVALRAAWVSLGLKELAH